MSHFDPFCPFQIQDTFGAPSSLAFCAGKTWVTGGFPPQQPSKAESVSMKCHHLMEFAPLQLKSMHNDKIIQLVSIRKWYPSLSVGICTPTGWATDRLSVRPFVVPSTGLTHAKLVSLTSPCCSGWPAPMNTQGQQRELSSDGCADFKNAYELLTLRALKISMFHKTFIFQCMGKIF